MPSPRPRPQLQRLSVTTRLFHLCPIPTSLILLKHFSNIIDFSHKYLRFFLPMRDKESLKHTGTHIHTHTIPLSQEKKNQYFLNILTFPQLSYHPFSCVCLTWHPDRVCFAFG